MKWYSVRKQLLRNTYDYNDTLRCFHLAAPLAVQTFILYSLHRETKKMRDSGERKKRGKRGDSFLVNAKVQTDGKGRI